MIAPIGTRTPTAQAAMAAQVIVNRCADALFRPAKGASNHLNFNFVGPKQVSSFAGKSYVMSKLFCSRLFYQAAFGNFEVRTFLLE
jgi:hypothetical protein